MQILFPQENFLQWSYKGDTGLQGDASLSSRMGLSTKLGELVPHIFYFQARGKTKLSYTLNSLKAHITFELNEGDRAAGALGLKLWEGI